MGGASSAVSSSITSAVSSVPVFLPIQTKEESLPTLLTEVALAVEEFTAAVFQVAAALWHVARALGAISSFLIVRFWQIFEPIVSFLGQLETSTRWTILSTTFLIIAAVIMHRRGTVDQFGGWIRKLRQQMVSAIPCLSVLIFFDIIPRFYLSSYIYRCLHLILVFAVPTTFSAFAVAEDYLISCWCPDSATPRFNSGRSTGRSTGRRSATGSVSDTQSITGSPRRSRLDHFSNYSVPVKTKVPPLALGSVRQMSFSSETSAGDFCLFPASRTQLPLWLEYWVVVNLLRFFLSVITSTLEKVLTCCSASTSPLDSFSLLKPLNADSCTIMMVRALGLFSVVHTILEFVNVLLVVAVRQGNSEVLHPIKDYLAQTIENIVELFTGLKIMASSPRSYSRSHKWLAPLLQTWQQLVVSYVPSYLLWMSRIMLKLPQVCLLCLPTFLLRPSIVIVGVIFPAVSGLRELHALKGSSLATMDGVSKWVAYFVLLAISDAVWSCFGLITGGVLPFTAHLQYVSILGIQLLAASPEALGQICTNITSTAISLTPRPLNSRHSIPSMSYIMRLNSRRHSPASTTREVSDSDENVPSVPYQCTSPNAQKMEKVAKSSLTESTVTSRDKSHYDDLDDDSNSMYRRRSTNKNSLPTFGLEEDSPTPKCNSSEYVATSLDDPEVKTTVEPPLADELAASTPIFSME